MTDSGRHQWPPQVGYDGWAVINLDRETIVRVNKRGADILNLNLAGLPVSLATILTTSDLALLTERAVPDVRTGTTWSGRLRLGVQRADVFPSPVVLVPHLDDSDGPAEYASLLFGADGTAEAAALVPDPLTGLPTRSALFRRLESAVRRNVLSETVLVALFIDLDGLKNVNDRYGHEVGDTALIETAQRISAQIPQGALAVRFGGDEFVVIYEDARDLDQAEKLALKILNALNAVGDYHAISASIGIAISRTGEVDAHELIRRADSAMYRAKASGGSQFAVFDAAMRTRQRNDEALRASLLSAISNNGFGVAAQPIFELATGRIRSVELFIRVRDDAQPITNANELFRLAHEYGEAFDAAVLGRALALAQVWRRSFGEMAPRVHINVSAQSLAAAKFASRVGDALAADNLPGSAIAFEIDGRDLSTAGERERATVEALRELGTPLVVDGFGDGSLALKDLAAWAPAMVKLPSGVYDLAVLTGLLRGVSSLRIPTCVKGMTTHGELQQALAIGAFCGQGNALTPVRGIERINAQLSGPQRLGF